MAKSVVGPKTRHIQYTRRYKRLFMLYTYNINASVAKYLTLSSGNNTVTNIHKSFIYKMDEDGAYITLKLEIIQY